MRKEPKDESISFRTLPKNKRAAQRLPCTYEDIFVVGLEHLSKEINRLEHEKGELELEKAELDKRVSEIVANITAINNRIRIIAPARLDKETLAVMIDDASMDYAKEIYGTHGKNSLERIKLDSAQHAILKTAREWGYDGSKFLQLVEEHLIELCNTKV